LTLLKTGKPRYICKNTIAVKMLSPPEAFWVEGLLLNLSFAFFVFLVFPSQNCLKNVFRGASV